MARPRVFISSTFIDYRQVRADIENFLNNIGYDSVLFERGQVPYAHDASLDVSAYSEVERSDLLVAIIGNRFGTTSSLNSSSITQNEIKRASDQDKPIFIFVDQNTLAEYKTWEKNRGVEGVKFAHADDPKIFEFVHSIFSLKRNNPVFPFHLASDISSILKEQFAGLFQSMLARRTAASAQDLISSLRELASSLEGMIGSIVQNGIDKDFIMDHILLVNHPLFKTLNRITWTPYRIYFKNLAELKEWLKARGWEESDSDWGDFDHHVWKRQSKEVQHKLKIAHTLFDTTGDLKPMRQENWSEELAIVEREQVTKTKSPSDLDDDIPF